MSRDPARADVGPNLEGGAGGRLFLVRHGETPWSLSGRHTGTTDVPLTDEGRAVARRLAPALEDERFALVLSSPRLRALETARLAGLGERIEVDPDLAEWDYGDYEGLTTAEIRERVPGWTVFTHPCPGGETADAIAARAERVIERVRAAAGDVAVFSHGHMGRVLTARWLSLPTREGRRFALGTATVSVLSFERDVAVVALWNAPPAAGAP
ncbi:alpha-ribazole phosphatase [Myxococcaceae bacterium]|jgi:probable phosphoglycerate mutase|nr:alpha-ribazole phosphatase [Myxococcaceae bacterium]